MEKVFSRIATSVAAAAGRPLTFALCCAGVLVWAFSGPIFGFTETWQLIINTSTTIITFLMVFLIQNTQNCDNVAIQTKLDELIRVSEGKNRLIGMERLTTSEVENLRIEVEEAVAEIESDKSSSQNLVTFKKDGSSLMAAEDK